MRTLFIIVAVVGLIGIAIYMAGDRTPPPPTKEEQQIIDALNEALRSGTDRACLYAVPFPFSSVEARGTGITCDRCEDLYESGLVTKDVREFESAGKTEFDTRYELTDLGRSIFTPGEEDASAGEVDGPRFCFGRTVLHKLVGAFQPPVGGKSQLAITYIAKLENPHPFLFDARSKPLRLPIPDKDEPHVFSPDRWVAYVGQDGKIMFVGTWNVGTK